MHTRRLVLLTYGFSLLFLLVGATPLWAKDGDLRLRVTPSQAYVYIDGQPRGGGSHHFRLAVGDHTLGLYNYGYKSETRHFTISSGAATSLEVTMQPVPGTVSGPWGRLQIEGPGKDAVLLNGKTPDFLVGHVDEFNHDIIWKQELLVPPGTHQVTVLHAGDGQEVYSGPATVLADRRVIIDLNKKGAQRTTDWPRGKTLSSVPRFKAGVASATVAVAQPSAQLSASATQIDCGGTAQLRWSSSDAVKVEISGVGGVATSGEQAVQPKQTTAYKLTAAGPGGTSSADATVNVNSALQASLSVSPAEITFRKVGDKVVEQGSATLAWSASGADSVSLDPLGSVAASGSRTIQAVPRKTDPGLVDETLTYTLRGTNACGGTATQTATLHLTGAIEVLQAAPPVTEKTLEVKLSLNSIYFPTALPRKGDLKGGLVTSQQARLQELASSFKQYLEFRPEAHLILQAHADKRGTGAYNMALSERRAESVEAFLLEQGIAASSIETKAFGKEQNLDEANVKQLTEQNPNLSPADRQRVLHNLAAFILANNRRVDVTLSTTGQQSQRFFPYNSDDLTVLMGAPPKAKAPAKKAAPKK